jgi:hypothetical protein
MTQDKPKQAYEELTLTDIGASLKIWWKAMLSRWVIIVIIGLTGGAVGLGASYIVKPTYTAHLSFALIDKGGGASGLASLASNFGLGSLFGGGGSAFSGDNLLQILQSRHAVESSLLSATEFQGDSLTLMDAYIRFMEMNKSWKKSKDPQLANLSFPIGQDRETFSRMQDSVLYEVYYRFVNSRLLKVTRRDKKISMVTVDFKSHNEQFSKDFVEMLMERTYEFYKHTRTAQSRVNVDVMQRTADSIRNLYETAMLHGAEISSVNVNMARQLAAVPRMKHENDAQMYAAVYGEVLKNLETLKLDLARETPLVQIIDKPRFPLKKEKLGRIKGVALGGFIGGVLIVGWLTFQLFVRNNGKEITLTRE